ncbi:MAG: hypothetical protein ABI550_02435 [Ignavibacteriaceae bacterium]
MKILIILSIIIFQLIACNAQTEKKEPESIDLNMIKIEPKVDALIKQYQDLDIFSGVVLIAKKGLKYGIIS